MAKSNRKNYGGNQKFKNNGTSNYAVKHPKKQGCQETVDGTPYKTNQLNRRNSTRNQRRGEEIADTAVDMSRGNPVEYYTKFDQFITDAAKLPFAKPLGTNVPVGNILSLEHALDNPIWNVPGAAVLYFTPSIGVSKDFSSPINRSSVRFYTYLRSNQKASGNYDHQDVTMMEVAMDSAYMYHALLRRVYGIVNLFTPANEYYSRALVAACGFIFDDVRAHLQDLRGYINAYAYSLGQYALPSSISLFDRHRWMVEGLYTDGESSKAQTYIFVPSGFWTYDNTVSTGSQCTWKPWIDLGSKTMTQHTVQQAINFGTELLNAVSNDEDFAVISGDIYNFYGGDVYKLPYVEENYAVLPTYNKTVLSQIENANIVGLLASDSLVISQNPQVNAGAIIFKPVLQQKTPSVGAHPMNFHWDSPTPQDVIEASRLMTVVQVGATDVTIEACGTEIVNAMVILSKNPTTGGFRGRWITHNILESKSQSEAGSAMEQLTLLSQFDWAPLTIAVNSVGDVAHFEGFSWDVDNFDLIPADYIANIHLGALLSLFTVGNNRQ